MGSPEQEAVKFRERTIATSKVPTDPIRCPGCGSRNLVLNGHMSYPHEEVLEQGLQVSEETDWDYEQPFELALIACLDCKTKYTIERDDVLDTRQENEALQAQILSLTRASEVN